jgi:hypothetical protein
MRDGRAEGTLLRAGFAVLAGLALASRAIALAAPPAAPPALLERLLDRAAATAPGTYTVSERSLDPAPETIPLVVQADAYRGPGSAATVAVLLGGEVPPESDVRLRIVAVPGGQAAAPRVVGDATARGQTGRLRLVREFPLASGDYEIQAVAGRRGTGEAVTAALARLPLAVPDVWSGPLAVTPIVLGAAVAAMPRAAEARPFVFGPHLLAPAASDAFARAGELHVAFRVFNWKAEGDGAGADARPDLTVDYAFYEQTGDRLTFFNRMKPQALNAATLGPGFDARTGVVSAGVSVPLEMFPYGRFQMRVRVTDNRSRQAAARQVRFRVSP